MSTYPDIALDDDVVFDRDLHAYLDTDGTRRMSVTQALTLGGLVDFSHVPEHIMKPAQERGKLVHHAGALVDRGEDLNSYLIPDWIEGYIEAYLRFQRELHFIPDSDWVERPMIVELFGHRVGMTPDVFGLLDGIPTLVDRKSGRYHSPAWGVQLAGYEAGLLKIGLQVRQRIAVQLSANGTYKVLPYDDQGDFDTFAACFRLACWKLKHQLVRL